MTASMWLDHGRWQCKCPSWAPNIIEANTPVLSWRIGCSYCRSKRPSEQSRPPPKDNQEKRIRERSRREDPEHYGPDSSCSWSTCTNDRRKGSKYCSRDCSNKNARSRFKTRHALT
jgi:hypothetical protein